MTNILQNFTFKTAVLRASQLLRGYGLTKTMAVAAAKIDDQYLKLFDRKYNIATSGHVELCDTSFDPSKLSRATAYGPVNGWAFRGLLQELNLPKTCHFVDLGSGLGRPCIIAADYGFERVTGVELAFELHTTALENVNQSNLPPAKKGAIHLIHGDVLEYCDRTDDDVFFIFRAFSLDFYDVVRKPEEDAHNYLYGTIGQSPGPGGGTIPGGPESSRSNAPGPLGAEFLRLRVRLTLVPRAADLSCLELAYGLNEA